MERGMFRKGGGMGSCVVVHRRPAASLKARVASWHLVPVEIWRLKEKRVALMRTRVAFARMVATTPHPPWVTEEAVKARRPRHLLEDNPASG
jgi:hypothetical protein